MTEGARCSWARRAQPEIPGGKFFFADVTDVGIYIYKT